MILIMFQIKRKSENFKFDYSIDQTWKTVIAVYFFLVCKTYQVTFHFAFLCQYNQVILLGYFIQQSLQTWK